MNEVNIKEGDALFDNFLKIRPVKGKLYDALTISLLFYIAFVLADLAVDVQKLSLKKFDWQLAFVIVILPLLGLIFHLTNKRIGWIVNSFYYPIITLLALYGFLQGLHEKKSISTEWMNWRVGLLLLLALTATALLFSRPIRNYFRVSVPLSIITFGISVGLAIIMILTLVEN